MCMNSANKELQTNKLLRIWSWFSIIITLLLGHAGMISIPPWTILSLWKHYSALDAKAF